MIKREVPFQFSYRVVAIYSVLVLLMSTGFIFGSDSSIENPHEEISAEKLDRTISQVIRQREYQWRYPREKAPDNQEDGLIMGFLQSFMDWVGRWIQPIQEMFMKLRNWIRRLVSKSMRGTNDENEPNLDTRELLLYILLAAVVLAIVIALGLIWRRRRSKTKEIQAEPISIVPDIEDENISADQLAEDAWQNMARGFLAQGQFRLALRALYMACLAFLGRSELITIAKYKSNREYQMELQRRAHDHKPVLEAFGENVKLFERSWYGLYEVTEEIIDRFSANQDRMKTGAQG